MPKYPHVPAAFINAIAEEGTKAEAVEWLQKQWNETCALRAALSEVHRRTGLLLHQNTGRWDMTQEHIKRASDVLIANQSIVFDALNQRGDVP